MLNIIEHQQDLLELELQCSQARRLPSSKHDDCWFSHVRGKSKKIQVQQQNKCLASARHILSKTDLTEQSLRPKGFEMLKKIQVQFQNISKSHQQSNRSIKCRIHGDDSNSSDQRVQNKQCSIQNKPNFGRPYTVAQTFTKATVRCWPSHEVQCSSMVGKISPNPIQSRSSKHV